MTDIKQLAISLLDKHSKDDVIKNWQKLLTAFRLMAESEPRITNTVIAAMCEMYQSALSSKEERKDDVTSVPNLDEDSVASHSCTVGNSIGLVIELLINAHNLLAKSSLSMEDYSPISLQLAQIKTELFALLNNEQGVQGSVATDDPSSNAAD